MMHIPESAITPFEPHGIPKLRTNNDVLWQAFSMALDDLNSYSKKINSAMILRTMRYYIRDALDEAGADYVSIKIRGPYNNGNMPVCHITVYCKMPNGPRRHMGGPVWSTNGFELII